MLTKPNGVLSSFAYPLYRRIWATSVVFALGNWGERLAVGWVVLNETDSVFLTAATFAVRQAPQLFVAPIGGALSDRFSRGKILLLTGLYKALVLSFMAMIAANGLEPLWLMCVLLGLSGIGHSVEIPCVQGMVTGSVPRDVRMNAVAVQSTGMRAVGAAGALAAGLAIDRLGVPITLIASGLVFGIAGFLAMIVNRGLQVELTVRTKSVVRDVIDGLQLMSRLPLVRMILITAVLVEIFGFSYGALMPAVAKEALGVDVKGLGMLTMMAGVGSVAGSVFLMALGNFAMLIACSGLAYALLTAVFGIEIDLNLPPGVRF